MKKLIWWIVFLCFFSFSSLAQTTDESYDGAVNKYFLGDNDGAVFLLNKVLADDPTNTKALALLTEIRSEGEPLWTPTTRALIVPTTMAPATLLGPQVVSRHRPIVAPKIDKNSIVENYYDDGRKYFETGDFLVAEANFRRVLELMPEHQGASVYLEKLAPMTSIVPEGKTIETAQISFFDNLRNVIASPFFLAVLLLLILFASGFFLGISFLYSFWRARHLYCPECGARSRLEAEFCHKCGYRLKKPELTPEQQGWFGKFCWAKNPFTLNIIPDAYAGHKTEISIIVEKLNTLSGHMLIIGGLGTGKTTLLQWLEKNLKDKFETIYLLRPPSRTDELIDLVSATISKKTTHTRKYSIYEFQKLCRQYKRNILLLLDEAHEFNEEFEQFLRTLGDLPNMYLVMAGLPQAREKLKRDLPALFDRIVETVLLGALSLPETTQLILNRIKNSSGDGLGPFTVAAVEKIFDMSYGIPRSILKICDWVVTQAVRANKIAIDVKDVEAYSEQIQMARLHDEEEEHAKS
ncbi:MAG: AAA family ATPase [bacterium]